MNTKIVMACCAIILGASGVLLSFIPDLVVDFLNLEANQLTSLLLQILGALYFAFEMLNWMTKSSLIGGIYNHPIVVANVTHFLIAGLAIIKLLSRNSDLPILIWITGIIYAVFSLLFGIMLFRHPIPEKN